MRPAGGIRSGGGGSSSVESRAAYLEESIGAQVETSAGVAFVAFETEDLPEGFMGSISFEIAVRGGTDEAPVGGYSFDGRANLQRSTGGALSVSDVQTSPNGAGTSYLHSSVASGNRFRAQVTLGTSTTATVSGWYRIFGGVVG